MKVAFDENLPIAMVKVFEIFASQRAFRKISGEFEIESARAYTPKPNDHDFQAKNDAPWIERFAKAGGRVIISGNTDIINVPHERLALLNSGIITVFFAPKWNNRTFFDKCAHIMLWWPVIAKKVRRAKPGSFWKVPNDWTAVDAVKGKLLRVSNRDPRELRLERRAKAVKEGRAAKRRVLKERSSPKDLFSATVDGKPSAT